MFYISNVYNIFSFIMQISYKIFEFFNVKTKNDCGGHVIFQDIEHQLREKILDNFLHYNVL